MREIKFRGKVVHHDPMTNPDDGWVYGFYYQDLDNGEIKHYIISCPMIWRVIPETVGQYTGLKDKNGKEIYEGDILSDQDGNIGVVIYNNDYYAVDFGNGFELQSYDDGIYEVCNVAGNVHDNPELLKSPFNK